jgi:hypothetical protein
MPKIKEMDEKCRQSKPCDMELGCSKWSQFRVNRAYKNKNNRKGLELTSNGSFNFRHVGKECVEISYFDFNLKNNIVILWTENLISDTVH